MNTQKKINKAEARIVRIDKKIELLSKPNKEKNNKKVELIQGRIEKMKAEIQLLKTGKVLDARSLRRIKKAEAAKIFTNMKIADLKELLAKEALIPVEKAVDKKATDKSPKATEKADKKATDKSPKATEKADKKAVVGKKPAPAMKPKADKKTTQAPAPAAPTS